jgi:hypothetical protein
MRRQYSEFGMEMVRGRPDNNIFGFGIVCRELAAWYRSEFVGGKEAMRSTRSFNISSFVLYSMIPKADMPPFG